MHCYDIRYIVNACTIIEKRTSLIGCATYGK